MDATPVSWLWLLPALPAVGALLNATVGRLSRREPVISTIAIVPMVAAFALALWALRSPRMTQHLWRVADSGGVRLDVGLRLDEVAIVLLLVVTGIGALIHVYATGYMARDPAFWRFFVGMNLFVAAMLVLVLADNLALLFAGWEGVGFCSWFLIGFWHQDVEKVKAANKAFVVNRIGDVGLVVGMLMLFWSSGIAPTFDFAQLQQRFEQHLMQGSPAPHWATLGCLLVFAGAMAKSAQVPLHGWLPDAMVGPTPVSALIHAATMVTAGVYLLIRLKFLFALSPVAMHVVAVTGTVTALYAASCALAQTDFKRVLAYSTISQLGFMFLAVGVGAWGAALFHLVTHAFFKACLFLGAGAVLHATHQNDLRQLGGLRSQLKIVAATYGFSALALAGLPIAGSFFSKDFILDAAFTASPLLWLGGSVAALGTAAYAWRSYALAFGGSWRGAHPATGLAVNGRMNAVLVVLALGALATGLLPLSSRFFPHAASAAPWLYAVAIAVAVVGVVAAHRFWKGGPRTATTPRIAAFLGAGWGVEVAYRRMGKVVIATSHRLAGFDRLAIDGVVDAFASIVHYLCLFEAAFDFYVVDGTVHLVGEISMRTGRALRRLQSGDLMRYLYVAVAGALIVVCLQYWLR